ncbi:MAG: toprim domain-containing protein [Proteobacteria bacterium]|nr:toprim domain-containing protein [Pseudomonadota bacterium]
MNDLKSYARALGGEQIGPQSVSCPGPGHSARDRSLSVYFDPYAPNRDGFIVYSHAGDDPIQCRDYVREKLRLPRRGSSEAPTPRPTPIKAVPDVDDADRIKAALRIWDASKAIGGTIVTGYLSSRALDATNISDDVIRYHPALRTDSGTTSGMVCLLRDIITDSPCGIHRTFVDDKGQKIGRKMLGRARGAAIKIDADEDVSLGLTIGEGVETCLAARQLGYRPGWALGSAVAIENFPHLRGIETLTILTETDDHGANERATKACARRWLEAGSEVIAIVPRGGDMNDELREARA